MSSLEKEIKNVPYFIIEFPLSEGGEDLKEGEYRLPRKADIYQSLTFSADQPFTAKITLLSRDIEYQEWFFPGEAYGWNRMTVNVNIPMVFLIWESWKIRVETAPDNKIQILARGKIFTNISDVKHIREGRHEWKTVIGHRTVLIRTSTAYPKYSNGKQPDEYCTTIERNDIYSLYPINYSYFEVESILKVQEHKEEETQTWIIDLPTKGICREITLELTDNRPLIVQLLYNNKMWQKWFKFQTIDSISKITLPLDAPLFLSQPWNLSITNDVCNKEFLSTDLKVTAKIRIYEKDLPEGQVITVAQKSFKL